MSVDALFRQIEGRLLQLSEHLDIKWEDCPKNFSSYSEEEREGHCYGYEYCDDGIITGYGDHYTCDICKGAGVVISKGD